MIVFELTKIKGYNEYINACRRNKYAGARMKADIETEIMWQIKAQLKQQTVNTPVTIKFTWVEENEKRDLDNICSAKKFILDSLVKLNIIPNDNRKYVIGFEDKFPKVREQAKVIVEIEGITQ